jgi:hypothetical protein
MTIVLYADSDLPRCLNTASKQDKRARKLAQLRSGIPVKRTARPNPQGFFSRTVFVTLKNGEEVVIQFRPDPLNIEPFKLARKVLGEVVPEVKLIEDDEELTRNKVWVYPLTRIPGETWLDGAAGNSEETRATTLRSLGRIFARGFIADNSELVVDSVLRPHLELLLASTDTQIGQLKDEVKELIAKLDQLKTLPLFIAHFDL